MANRLVLGSFFGTYGLRISRPGYNVLNSGLTANQLAFDSRWQETGAILTRGSFSMTSSQLTFEVYYPAAVAQPPVVYFYGKWIYPNGAGWYGIPLMNSEDVQARVFTDRFQIYKRSNFNGPYQGEYIVFENLHG